MKINKLFLIFIVCLLQITWVSTAIGEDLGRIIFVRNGDIWQIELNNKKESLILKNAAGPSFSRDGKYLAFIRKENIWIKNIQKDEVKQITHYSNIPENEPIESIEWFPDGKRIAYSIGDEYVLSYRGSKRKVYWPPDYYEEKKQKLVIRNIWISDIDGKYQKKWIGNTFGSGTTGTMLSDVDCPKWSPKGDLLVFSRNGDIWLAGFEKDDLVEMDKNEARINAAAVLMNHYGASSGNSFADHFSWSPEGDQIIYDLSRYHGSGWGAIWRFNVKNNEQTKILDNLDTESFPQISPDGKKIAYIAYNKDSSPWILSLWIMNIDGTSQQIIIEKLDWDNLIWLER